MRPDWYSTIIIDIHFDLFEMENGIGGLGR